MNYESHVLVEMPHLLLVVSKFIMITMTVVTMKNDQVLQGHAHSFTNTMVTTMVSVQIMHTFSRSGDGDHDTGGDDGDYGLWR